MTKVVIGSYVNKNELIVFSCLFLNLFFNEVNSFIQQCRKRR